MHHSARGGEKDKWNQAETQESHILWGVWESCIDKISIPTTEETNPPS